MDKTENNISVLREMIRLAEHRRDEERDWFERLNTYNFALIAFSGSFLSLLLNTEQAPLIVRISGAFLIGSIVTSLLAIRPRTIHGGTIIIDYDVQALEEGQDVPLDTFLLETAKFTELAAQAIATAAAMKTRLTIFSAIFLATALLITYALYDATP